MQYFRVSLHQIAWKYSIALKPQHKYWAYIHKET